MSIAEKLETIAENQQLVYDAGFEAGKAEGGGGEDLWQYATNLYETFKGFAFPSNYELTLTVPAVKSITNMIYESTNLTKLTLLAPASNQAIGGTYCFTHSSIIEIDLSNFRYGGIRFTSGAKYPFRNCNRLKYIRGEIDMSSVTDTLHYFTNDNQLIEVRFKAGTIEVDLTISSPNLSAASVQSIIDGLMVLPEGTTKTLSLSSTVLGNLTDDQMNIIGEKHWTV